MRERIEHTEHRRTGDDSRSYTERHADGATPVATDGDAEARPADGEGRRR